MGLAPSDFQRATYGSVSVTENSNLNEHGVKTSGAAWEMPQG